MAIDPSISLGVRPPQIAPLQLQTPLDRYQKMLTLRHLMTQQQTGALNLEQTRLENEALREKGVQQREQTARAAQFRQRASQLQPGESIAPGEAYELLGPEAGGDLLRNQAQQEVATNNLRIQQLEKLQAAAAASTDQASLTRNVMQLINAKVLPWQMARDILDVPFDAKAVQEAGMSALNLKDQLLAKNAELERQYLAKMRPLQIEKAEQDVKGTQPLTEYQQAQLDKPSADQAAFQQDFLPGFAQAQGWTGELTPKQRYVAFTEFQKTKQPVMPSAAQIFPRSPAVEAQDIRIAQAKDEGPKALRNEIRAQTIGTQWQQSSKLLERYRVAAANYDSLKLMLAGGGPQDMALIYSYAKAIDENSVVKESEKDAYIAAGNPFLGALAKFNGKFDPRGGFLSPQVKADFFNVLKARMEANRKQVMSEHGEIKRQQEVISPGSSVALFDPTVLDPEDFKAKDLKGSSTDELLRKLLEKRK